jgi:hypothetical protein
MDAARPTARRSRLAPWGLAALCIAALAAAGAGDRDLPPDPSPPYQVGTLEGYVFDGGEPATATSVSLCGPYDYQPLFEPQSTGHDTKTDSTGFYHLDLPCGTYRIEGQLGHLCREAPRTVVIEPGVQRLDLRFGRVDFSIRVGDGLEDLPIGIDLQSIDSHCLLFDQAARVREGRIVGSIPHVHPGTYRLGMRNWGRITWLPGTLDFEEGDTLAVGADQPTEYAGAIAPPAILTGRLEGAGRLVPQSRPVGATILGPDSTQVGHSQIAADGSFTFVYLMPVPVKIRIEANGIVRWVGGDSYETAIALDLRPGERVEDLVVPDCGIVCRLDGPGPMVEYDAQLALRDDLGRSYLTDPQERNPLVACNLPPGRYFVQARGCCLGQGWASRWFGDAAEPIEISAGELARVTIHLLPGGHIRGRIFDRYGDPADAAPVRIYDARGVPLCDRPKQTAADGSFELGGLADGQYYLAIDEWPHPAWWYPGTFSIGSATEIRIRGHATVSGIEWAEATR